jgi:hypothetical protein
LKLDINYTHSKNVAYDKNPVGHFCSSPIREIYTREVELDQIVEVHRTIEINRDLGPGLPVEVLPGELICDDHIVRRDTTSEAIGAEFYEYEFPQGARKVSIKEARQLANEGAMVTFRPNRQVGQEEFAIVYEEE